MSSFQDVRSAITSKNSEFLRSKYGDMKEKFLANSFLREGNLFEIVGSGLHQLNRNFPAEIYIPSFVNTGDNKKHFVAVR